MYKNELIEKSFSKEDTFVLKGISILIILIHHIFWNEFTGSTAQQVFLFKPITFFLTKYGFCFNHIFFAITGYGLALKIDSNDAHLSIWITREKKILSLFIPVFVFSVFLYSLGMQIGANAFLKSVYNENIIKALVCFFIDSLGLSDLLKTPSLNPTWWYLSANHFVTLLSIVLILFAKKTGLYVEILFSIVLICIYFKLNYLYLNCLISCFVGCLLYKYNVVNKVDNIVQRIKIGKVLIFFLLVILLVVWYLGICLYEAHFVSALILPFVLFIFINQYISKIKILKVIFSYIGQYSGYIFLTHTFYYMLITRISDFVYCFNFGVETYAIVFSLSLLTAIFR